MSEKKKDGDGEGPKRRGWSSKRYDWGNRDLAAFLEQFEWHHLVTLTLRAGLSKEEAKKCVQQWLRDLGRRAGNRIGYWVEPEKGAGGRIHFHLTLQGTGGLKVGVIRRSWRYGRSSVQKYDPIRGGLLYMTKESLRDSSETMISKRLRLRNDRGGFQ